MIELLRDYDGSCPWCLSLFLNGVELAHCPRREDEPAPEPTTNSGPAVQQDRIQ